MRFTPALLMDVGYSHLFVKNASINQPNSGITALPAAARGSLVGDYDNSVDIVGVQIHLELLTLAARRDGLARFPRSSDIASLASMNSSAPASSPQSRRPRRRCDGRANRCAPRQCQRADRAVRAAGQGRRSERQRRQGHRRTEEARARAAVERWRRRCISRPQTTSSTCRCWPNATS